MSIVRQNYNKINCCVSQFFASSSWLNPSWLPQIHGTYRQKGKVYREDIYFGKGKDIDSCSKEELKADLQERESENVLAYRGSVQDEQVQEVKKRIS